MKILSRKFFNEFKYNPGEALDYLKKTRSRFTYTILNFLTFFRVVFSEYMLNHCFTRGSAMAFALLFTLIPLVASAAFMFASIVEVDSGQVQRFFSFWLPFAPQTVLDYLGTFFTNARKLRGLGVITLVIVTVGLFGTVEESINTIWKEARSRSFFVRLRTYTMAMVYSPVLFLASFQVRRSLRLDLVEGGLAILDLLPFLLMVLAFTSLIWFVPNTRVRFKSALLGGLTAGILFELERKLFGTYVRFSMQTEIIYGTLGIIPLFLFSLFLVSLIVLFGVQIAFVHQNYRPLLRAKRRWDRRVGDYKTYITFRMVFDCVAAFIRKRKPVVLSHFITTYELTEPQALGMLRWLIHEGFLHSIGSRGDSFVPARDFSRTPVREVLNAIEDQSRRIPSVPDDFTKDYVASLIQDLKGREYSSDEITFEIMVEEIEAGQEHTSRVEAVF
ncbi:MAG: YihY family inner membrane protein [Fibrobacter sp.]|nr:YihY family inner membrane protein [Fibrobacter sp.]